MSWENARGWLNLRARARAGEGGGVMYVVFRAIYARTTCPVSWHTFCPTWLSACACCSGVVAAAPQLDMYAGISCLTAVAMAA